MRRSRSLLSLLLTFAGCGAIDPPPTGVRSGEATACLGQTIEEAFPVAYVETPSWIVEGTVLSFGPVDAEIVDDLVACGPALSQVLRVETPDTIVWTLGFGVEDPAEGDVTDPLDVAVGDAVSLTFRAVQSFGGAAGFVLTDGDGLVAALEVGTWGPALQAGDLPAHEVGSGALVIEEDDACGTVGHYETLFWGAHEEPDAYAPGSWGPVQGADGVVRGARAIMNYDYIGPIGCTDTGGAASWAIWR